MKRQPFYRNFDRYAGIPLLALLTIFLKRNRKLPSGNINKILFVKLAAIGDTVLLIPALRTLKKAFPDSELTFLCTPVNYSVVSKIPYVDKIINVNVHSFLKNILKFAAFLKELRSIHYDVSIDGGQWERMSALMAVLAKAKYYIGFRASKQHKHYIYDSSLYHDPDKHETENFLDLLKPLGVKLTPEDKKLEYFLSENDYKFAEDFWSENDLSGKKVVVFHPGCGIDGKAKEWDADNFVELGRRLLKDDPETRIVLTGSEIERYLTSYIAKNLGSSAIDISGRSGVGEAIAILKKADTVVVPNTGILHMAASVDANIIALHGPSNTTKWGPSNEHSVVIQSDKFCSPCTYLGSDYGCDEPTCMAHITVDDVYYAVRKVISPKMFSGLNIVYN